MSGTTLRRAALIAALALTGCQMTDEAGGAPDVGRALPGWVEPNFTVDPRSARPPAFDDPEIVFTLRPGDCTRAADAYGPGDCARGAGRTAITTGQVWDEGADWEPGQMFLYSFEFRVDPALSGGGARAPVAIARWKQRDRPGGTLFDLAFDPVRGVTFLGRPCVPAEALGGWHRFNLRIRWAADATGFIEARCDGSLHAGPPVFARSGLATDRPLRCTADGTCGPVGDGGADRFQMDLGIIADAPGARATLPREGLTVAMRRLVVRRLYVVFGRYESY